MRCRRTGNSHGRFNKLPELYQSKRGEIRTTTSNNPETVALHAGYRDDPSTGAVAVPIYQTTAYQFENTETACKLFALEELGSIYTRVMNPTTDVLEQRMAALESGAAALATSSGQTASALAIQNIASSGDNIVSSYD